MRFLFSFLLLICLCPCGVWAATNDSSIAIYGSSCEAIRENEVKSTTRVRATDKASFLAISTMSDLAEFKKNMGGHDFNVMVYDIVDNMIDDLTVNTSKQTDKEICVEANGFVSKDNLTTAVKNFVNKKDNQESLKVAEKEVEEIRHEINETAEEKLTEADKSFEQTAEQSVIEKRKASLLVVPVEFYNNTKSNKYAKVVRDVFEKSEYLELSEVENTNYTILPKVLKAKIDNINSTTNRLQMVVALEIKSDDGLAFVEHQNRFLLFNNTENEQDVAFRLMKKLFEQASDNVLSKIELREMDKQKGSAMITPQ